MPDTIIRLFDDPARLDPGPPQVISYDDVPLGGGAQGQVYRVHRLDYAPSRLLIKVTKSDRMQRVRRHAVRMVPYLQIHVPHRDGGLEALPSQVGVLEDGRVCYLMDHAPGKPGDARSGANEEIAEQLLPATALGRRLHLATQLASAVERLHRAGVIHADISADNVIIHLESSPHRLYLIDIDGGGIVPSDDRAPWGLPPQMLGKDKWWPPEVLVRSDRLGPDLDGPPPIAPVDQANLATDAWALAVQVHMLALPYDDPELGVRGLHPFGFCGNTNFLVEPEVPWPPDPRRPYLKTDLAQGRDVAMEEWYLPYLQPLGPRLLALFRRTFGAESGRFHPELRPTAREWRRGLAAAQRWVFQCANPNCAETFVAERWQRCIWCRAPVPHAAVRPAGGRPIPVLEDGFLLPAHRFHFRDGQYHTLRLERVGAQMLVVPLASPVDSSARYPRDARGALLLPPGTHTLRVWSHDGRQTADLEVSIPDAV